MTTADIENVKKDMNVSMSKMYLELKADRKLSINFSEKSLDGPYSFYTKNYAPSPEANEAIFIKYITTFSYENGIELEPNHNPPIFVNANPSSAAITLVIKSLAINFSGYKTKCNYTLKKLMQAETDLMKQGEKNDIDNQKKIEKEKAAQKEKADELKDGKLYTTADKVPFCSNESAAIIRVSEYLMNQASSYGLGDGQFNITAEFTINKDGSMADVSITGTDIESFKKSADEFIKSKLICSPADIGGQKVRFRMSKAFKFVLSDQ